MDILIDLEEKKKEKLNQIIGGLEGFIKQIPIINYDNFDDFYKTFIDFGNKELKGNTDFWQNFLKFEFHLSNEYSREEDEAFWQNSFQKFIILLCEILLEFHKKEVNVSEQLRLNYEKKNKNSFFEKEKNIERRFKEEYGNIIGKKIDPKLVFVIMAMNEKENPELTKIKNAIDQGVNCVLVKTNPKYFSKRIDDFDITNRITPKIFEYIRNAEFIIADLTFERPNVYYELGYAHAYGKTVIITAKNDTKLPFDIKDYNTIFYENFQELTKKITDILVNLGGGKKRQK